EGSEAVDDRIVITNSRPETSAMGVSSTNDITTRSTPSFELQANALLMAPPSARQVSQRRLTPGGAAQAQVAISSAAGGSRSAVSRWRNMRGLPRVKARGAVGDGGSTVKRLHGAPGRTSRGGRGERAGELRVTGECAGTVVHDVDRVAVLPARDRAVAG